MLRFKEGDKVVVPFYNGSNEEHKYVSEVFKDRICRIQVVDRDPNEYLVYRLKDIATGIGHWCAEDWVEGVNQSKVDFTAEDLMEILEC